MEREDFERQHGSRIAAARSAASWSRAYWQSGPPSNMRWIRHACPSMDFNRVTSEVRDTGSRF
jgi:hypothetical protein